MKSRLNHRLTGPELVMVFFQYHRRKLKFEKWIKDIDHAIEIIRYLPNFIEDKLHLLKMVKEVLEFFIADRNLNQIFPGSGPRESNFEYVNRNVVKLINDATKPEVDSDDETVSDELESCNEDAQMIVNIYVKGFPELPNYGSLERKYAFFMTALTKIMQAERPDSNDIEAAASSFDQAAYVQVWKKLIVKLKHKLQTKTDLPCRYIKQCIYFCQLAFGSLTAHASTFNLERIGFKYALSI